MVNVSFIFSSSISFAAPAISEISVVMDDNYPPYIFRSNEGEIQGILFDQWALWEEKTGVKVNLTATDWNLALSGMQSGQFDVIDTVFKNEERSTYLSFTEPYANLDVSIFFRNTISGITDADSLIGFIVGVKRGDASIEYLRERGIDTLIEYENYEKLVLAAAEGEVAAFVADLPPILYFLYKYNINTDFNHTKPLYTGQFHRGVAKGDAELLNLVEEGFSQISDEEKEAISAKWFGERNENASDLIEDLGLIGVVIGVVAVFMALWNLSLKRTVREKTSEIMAIAEKAEHNSKKLDAMVKAIPDLIFIVNSEGIVSGYMSNGRNQSAHHAQELFLNRSIQEIFPPDVAKKYMNATDAVFLDKNIKYFTYSVEIKGDKQYFEARLAFVEEDRILCMIRDITEERKSQDKIYEMSVRDAVTGLFNRTFFEEEIRRLSAKATENIGVIMCDIDGLKLINDTMGHQTGDFYLYSVGQILLSKIKDRGFIARIGGDEFACILPGASREEVLEIVNRISAEITEINGENSDEVPISVSIGYSIVGVDQETLQEAITEADDYMYRNKLHHRQSVRSYSVDLLSRLLAERDFITEGHGDRMQDNIRKLAMVLDFDSDSISDLLLFAQFHDIGKVGVPDAILYKEASLTESESAEMKRHSEIGFRIAESSPDLRHISEWILKHHEWWNGEGYPIGIKGVEIPLECRMLSIVDAFDAMTNDRPYQKARTYEEAFEELKKCSNTQFDPELVELFINMF